MKVKKITILYYAFISTMLFACTATETVEVKDQAGNLIEVYQVNKETLAKTGEYRRFDANGLLMEVAHFEDDILQGERKIYHEDGQTVQAIEQYHQGDFVGVYRAFFPNGTLKVEGEYVDNQMEGIWKSYYDTGELFDEVMMVHSTENGAFKEYHKNGQLKTEGTYRDGDNEHGVLKMYDEQGVLTKIMDCNMGRCVTRTTPQTTN